MEACLGASVITGIVTGMVNLTGDYFSALMFIVLVLVMLCLGLQLPLEVTAVLILPLLIVCYVCFPNFTATFGVTLIYLGIIFAKNFVLR